MLPRGFLGISLPLSVLAITPLASAPVCVVLALAAALHCGNLRDLSWYWPQQFGLWLEPWAAYTKMPQPYPYS